MTEDEVTKEETKEQVFELVQVSTQTETMIQAPDGKIIDMQSGIVMLLNEMKDIKKLVG